MIPVTQYTYYVDDKAKNEREKERFLLSFTYLDPRARIKRECDKEKRDIKAVIQYAHCVVSEAENKIEKESLLLSTIILA
jgi:hypothetical protein